MTAADLTPFELIGLTGLIALVGAVAGWWLARRAAWAPAAGLALLVATPLVPHVPVLGGLSLDDILPLLGIVFLAFAVDLRRSRRSDPVAPRLRSAILVIAPGS